MNELNLVMHHGGGQQRVEVGLFEPLEQVFDQIRHAVRRRCHVDEFGALVNAYSAPAECARTADQPLHQGAVGLEKIRHGRGLQGIQQLVGHKRVLHLLDLPRLPPHLLAIDDGRDLVETERVVFNRQRRVDAADAILPPQPRRHPPRRRFPSAQCFADAADQVDQPGGDGERRDVGHG